MGSIMERMTKDGSQSFTVQFRQKRKGKVAPTWPKPFRRTPRPPGVDEATAA
jgi:hypothetical protein